MNSLAVNNFKLVSIAMVGATVVGLGIGSAPSEAATVFTDEAAFLSNIQPGSYLQTFDSPPPTNPSSYFVTTTTVGGANRRPFLFSNPSNAADGWISTFYASDTMVFNFLRDISAVGGAFFPTNTDGNIVPGSITVTLSDGTTQTLTNTNSSSFIGFIADPGSVFTSLRVASVNPELEIYPTVNDFRVGTAIPTPALLPGLVAVGIRVLRKRKESESAAETVEV